MWKGVLSFGLVNVPVSLVLAARRERFSFRQLHAADRSPIKQERFCTSCGERVGSKDLVKGAEIAPDQYVVLTAEELDALEPESSRTLAIERFVDAREVDPVYRERSYALKPEPLGERAYLLLHDALSRREEVAIGRLTLRGREAPVAIRAGDRLLFVDVLHYPEEVRDLGDVERAVASVGSVTEEEASLADVLLDRLHRPWDPTRFQDEHARAVRDLIEKKARGETVPIAPARAKAATVDLLAALRETLAQEEAKRGAEA